MTRDEWVATLVLHGWVPLYWAKPIPHWGMSKAGLGSVHEDCWHKHHGPTVAPLVVSPYSKHMHERDVEIAWDRFSEHALFRIGRYVLEIYT